MRCCFSEVNLTTLFCRPARDDDPPDAEFPKRQKVHTACLSAQRQSPAISREHQVPDFQEIHQEPIEILQTLILLHFCTAQFKP